jgi:hypothetical protein
MITSMIMGRLFEPVMWITDGLPRPGDDFRTWPPRGMHEVRGSRRAVGERDRAPRDLRYRVEWVDPDQTDSDGNYIHGKDNSDD